jgi:3-dehydroquinate synthase
MMARFRVPLVTTIDDSYDIEIGERLFEPLLADLEAGILPGAHRLALITDSNVRELYGETLLARLSDAGLNVSLFSFPAGEKSKTRETKSALEDDLIRARFGRDSAVVALGGGVVSDLAGFLAGTFARGIPFVIYATTLLGAADASIGGKTAVDTPHATNLIGLFHQPKKVYVDTDTWNSLPLSEIRNGLAETVKHACLGDYAFFVFLEENVDRVVGRAQAEECLDPPTTAHIANKNCEIKYRVVANDVREANLRQVLNLGHTLGRALEPLTEYQLAHGQAVAIGLAFQMRLGKRFGYVAEQELERVERLLGRIGLPVRIPHSLSADRIIEKMYTDKKTRQDALRLVFQKGIGEMMHFEGGAWSRPVSERELRAALEESF